MIVIQTLHQHKAELKRFGVKKLSLFGSVARGDEKSDSDLDFLVELEHKSFDAFMGLKEFLEDLFNRKVDLVLADALKPRLRPQIMKEIVDAA